ncbi:intraflagellar transport protein 80 homolog [Styela clava]|uniref:intraflagellar transport protein 80 homolog n=1 Tax=Styela clava TaxID=7725 RepID=UPI001939271A|nr:intraflagellar transport protein 80 homolog [Styela clava]
MRFKISIPKDQPSQEVISCVAWSSANEVLSCGDDHQVMKWNLVSGETQVLTKFTNDVYCTHMHRFPTSGQGGKKQGQGELFAVTSTEGKFRLMASSGRIDKTIEAHTGAVISGKWSHDGTAFVTVGEDGQIKIWSRSGMLRSTLSQFSSPVYDVAWSPECDHLLYTAGKQLVIKSLQPSAKPVTWKGHDELILRVDWNPVSGLILSGGEDCKYKVWDSYGRPIYTSITHDYPITSLSWSPDGELFAIGSYNTLRLCDKSGWSHSLEKPATGSIFNVIWSNDGTQVACACAAGKVLFAHVIEQRLEWKKFEVSVVSRKTIEVRDVTNNAHEVLDMKDRIIKVSLGYDHLVVVTSSQCHVYHTTNFNTPVIFDLKEGTVSMITQSEKHFMLTEATGITIYSYEGRTVCSPKLPPSVRPSLLSNHILSLSKDAFAIRDNNEHRAVTVFETSSGKPLNDNKPILHKLEVQQLCLSQCGSMKERFLAVIDKNRDLYLTPIRKLEAHYNTTKLSTMMRSICWNDNTNMLCGVQENKLIVWYYPSVATVDKDIMARTVFEKDIADCGKNPELRAFIGNTAVIRQAAGATTTIGIPPYPSILHQLMSSDRSEEALRLCRFVKETSLWACLAAMSVQRKDLFTAEMAYAAIGEADKVEYLHHIQNIKSKEGRMGEISLFCGNVPDAEATFIAAGLMYRAIKLNVDLFRWERALELATKHKTHVDTVLGFRGLYLQKLGKPESIADFKNMANKVEVNWQNINNKIEMELEKEAGN